ncbi:MAG: DUF1501 domain-containing protein [Acidobacteriota bacterium]|nr:DUF1501 domain-containing protein [Acidobacteriota bacterium]
MPSSAIPVLSRRRLLQIGSVALSGFDLLPMLRPANVRAAEKVTPRGSAEYCIFVFLQGGASQLDTFDFKEGHWTPPDFDVRKVAPDVTLPIGLFPNLAKKLNRIAFVRSLETWETEHTRASYYMHVAHPISPARLAEIPTLGAVVAYEFRDKRKGADFMPPFVSMNYGPDQTRQGCLDQRFGPLNLDTKGGDLSFVVPDNEKSRFQRRLEYLRAMAQMGPGGSRVDSRVDPGENLDAYRRDALAMMQSPEIPKVLKLKDEEKVRYGGSPFGDSCILARNILRAESGTRFVAVHHGGWDFHTNIYDKSQKVNHYTVSRSLDQGLAELLSDLETAQCSDGRTLLDKTLVVCLGEFGRTPGELTPGKGRDHHRYAMTGLFAGAGVGGGRVIGATDDRGAKVIHSGWAKKRSIYPEDVAATIYSAMGIDWSKQITNTPSGRFFQYLEPQSGTNFIDVAEISPLFAT